MIVYPNTFVLSATTPLNHARIGYQTFTKDLTGANVTVSSESLAGPRDAPLRPDTFEYFEPLALPATWMVDFGALRDIDYVGLAGLNFGSVLATVGVSLSEDLDFNARMTLPGISGNYASTPDSVANSVVGDIDIRVKVSLVDWTPTGNPYLIDKNGFTTGGGYYLRALGGGGLQLGWSSGAIGFTANSISHGFADGSTQWVRATLDVDNGAAGYTVRFFTSVDGVVWNQLGPDQIVGTITSIGNNTSQLSVGIFFDGAADPLAGNIYFAGVYNVIDGSTPVVKFDPSESVTDALTHTASTGELWTVNRSGGTPARMINPRFGGAEILPADNAPIMFLDALRSARYAQVKLTGSGAMPRFAVFYAGRVLAMQRMIYGGHQPVTLSRQTQLKQPISRGGQFLGQSYRRLGVATSAAFKFLTAAWYRANFDPFVEEARKQPFFFAWRPQSFPLEIGYMWCADDIAPSNMGQRDLMEVSFKMTGIGNE